MRRRQFLRGVAGATVLASAGTVAGHPGPYQPFGSVPVTNAKEAVPDPGGEYAYVATTDGFAVVDLAVPADPRVVVERENLLGDRETGPLRLIQDVKVAGDRLAVAGPANPMQGDVLQGFVLYDVSDPADPSRVAFHETQFPIHNCFVRDQYVYLTGNNGQRNPLVIVDVSGDRPEEVARWSLLDRNERWGDVAPALRTLHDVWVGGDDRAYLAHWDAGTYILDVSDPTNPRFVSRVGGRPLDTLASISEQEAVQANVLRPPGNSHYAMTDDDASLLGVNKEAWEARGEGGPGGVELWDISDASSPQKLSTIDAPTSSDQTIGGTWTTSHNFDIVGDRLFTSWYQGGVKLHDISDPANPEQLAWWRNPEEASFWTAKRVNDRFFIASSYGRRDNDRGGFYTFPNHAGQQKDAPSLTTDVGNATAGTAETTTTTRTGGTTEAALEEGTTTTTAADGGNSGGTPGFGVSATLAALLGAGAWRTFRE